MSGKNLKEPDRPAGEQAAYTIDSLSSAIEGGHNGQTAHEVAENSISDPLTILSPFDQVVESYRRAQSSSILKSSLLPTLRGSEEFDHQTWDPYRLIPKKDFLCQALLDEKKLKDIQTRVGSVVSKVPKADQWARNNLEENFTATDICNIFRIALGGSRKRPSPTSESHVDSISALAEYVLGTADGLADELVVNERAKSIARLIGYALL